MLYNIITPIVKMFLLDVNNQWSIAITSVNAKTFKPLRLVQVSRK